MAKCQEGQLQVQPDALRGLDTCLVAKQLGGQSRPRQTLIVMQSLPLAPTLRP